MSTLATIARCDVKSRFCHRAPIESSRGSLKRRHMLIQKWNRFSRVGRIRNEPLGNCLQETLNSPTVESADEQSCGATVNRSFRQVSFVEYQKRTWPQPAELLIRLGPRLRCIEDQEGEGSRLQPTLNQANSLLLNSMFAVT